MKIDLLIATLLRSKTLDQATKTDLAKLLPPEVSAKPPHDVRTVS